MLISFLKKRTLVPCSILFSEHSIKYAYNAQTKPASFANVRSAPIDCKAVLHELHQNNVKFFFHCICPFGLGRFVPFSEKVKKGRNNAILLKGHLANRLKASFDEVIILPIEDNVNGAYCVLKKNYEKIASLYGSFFESSKSFLPPYSGIHRFILRYKLYLKSSLWLFESEGKTHALTYKGGTLYDYKQIDSTNPLQLASSLALFKETTPGLLYLKSASSWYAFFKKHSLKFITPKTSCSIHASESLDLTEALYSPIYQPILKNHPLGNKGAFIKNWIESVSIRDLLLPLMIPLFPSASSVALSIKSLRHTQKLKASIAQVLFEPGQKMQLNKKNMQAAFTKKLSTLRAQASPIDAAILEKFLGPMVQAYNTLAATIERPFKVYELKISSQSGNATLLLGLELKPEVSKKHLASLMAPLQVYQGEKKSRYTSDNKKIVWFCYGL